MSRTLPSWSTAPQIVTTAVDRQEHLVEVPLVAGSGLAAAQAGRVDGSELGAPLPDRLVRDDHAADQHEPLDLTEAQREPVIQPHAVRDDLRRIPVTLVRHLAHDGPSSCVSTPRSSASAAPLTNLTVPPSGIPVTPTRSFETLISRLFRDRFQFCSGLVDLVICVRRHGGGGHRLALAGERFVGLVAEDIAQVGDRGGDFRKCPGGEGIDDGETGNGRRRFGQAVPS